MNLIACTLPGGRVAIVVPVISLDDPQGFTDQQAFDRAMAKDLPAGALNLRPVAPAELPTRRFRNAWRQNPDGSIREDLPECRLQRLVDLRVDRDRRLGASDAKMLKATEQGTAQEQTDWKAYRQTLRGLTATIQTDLQALATADLIEAYTPASPVEPP